jgi:hypothetical protein
MFLVRTEIIRVELIGIPTYKICSLFLKKKNQRNILKTTRCSAIENKCVLKGKRTG